MRDAVLGGALAFGAFLLVIGFVYVAVLTWYYRDRKGK